MNQAENPLDSLRDIHLPDQIDTFQLAPGWWFLLVLLFCGLCFWIHIIIKKRKALALLKPLQQEIESLAALEPSAESVAKLSELMKRVTLIYYPRKKVSSLSGNQWIAFVNHQVLDLKFDEKQTEILSTYAYQKSPRIEKQDWQSLVAHSHKILATLITENSLNKRRGNI